MTDKRFKWLLIAASLTIFAVAFIWKYPEIAKAHASRDDARLGEYVYVDAHDVVHIDRKCSRLNYKGMRSERVKRESLHRSYDTTFCSKCVSDKDYEELR